MTETAPVPSGIGNQSVPYTLYQFGVPLILPGGGSIGNNGALTLTTALTGAATTYGNCYMYFPANAIAAGVAAGVYYVQMSSTTVGIIYNNVLASGAPTIITSPTAFVTTGPGAYAQTTASRLTLATLSIPAGIMGANGSLIVEAHASRISAATVCKLGWSLSGSDLGFGGVASVAWIGCRRIVHNMGSAALQAVFPISNGSPSDLTNVNTATSYPTVNTAAATSLTLEALITASATEWLICHGANVQVNYAP